MTRKVKRLATGVAMTLLVVVGAAVHDATAQVRPLRPRAAPPATLETPPASPAEIQGLFDAYMVVQAQRELGLSDDQWARFVTRMRVLQDARRKGQVERNRLLQELRRLSVNPVDDSQLRVQVKALSDLDDRTAGDVRSAVEAIDQVLTPLQQARFRLLEDQVERRKLDLVVRARQANRPRNQF